MDPKNPELHVAQRSTGFSPRAHDFWRPSITPSSLPVLSLETALQVMEQGAPAYLQFMSPFRTTEPAHRFRQTSGTCGKLVAELAAAKVPEVLISIRIRFGNEGGQKWAFLKNRCPNVDTGIVWLFIV